MGIDLKKGKPGLDLQKKPASDPSVSIRAKGLDLKKSPLKQPNNPPVVQTPGQMEPKRNGKWLLLLLLIPIIALVWFISNKGKAVKHNGELAANPVEEIADSTHIDKQVENLLENENPVPTQDKIIGRQETKNQDVPKKKSSVDNINPSVNKTPSEIKIEKEKYTRNRTPIDASNSKEVIHFEFDSFTLDETNQNLLKNFITVCQSNSATQILLDGFACNIGSDQANYEVSEARAKMVEQYLRKNGIEPGVKILISSYGSEYPVADNATKEGRAQNRRVVITFQ